MKRIDECEKALEAALEKLYGELGPSRQRDLEAHLADCGSCRQRAAEREDTARLLDAWETPVSSAPTSLRWHRAERNAAGWWSVLRSAAAGLLVAVIVFAGLTVAGASVTKDGERLVIAFGDGPGADVVLPSPQGGLTTIAHQICDRRFGELRDDLSVVFERFQGSEQQQRQALDEALRMRLDFERERTDRALQALRRLARADSENLERAVLHLIRDWRAEEQGAERK